MEGVRRTEEGVRVSEEPKNGTRNKAQGTKQRMLLEMEAAGDCGCFTLIL